MTTNVYIAAEIEPALRALIEADARFRIVPSPAQAHVAITRTTNRITREWLTSTPELRFIAQGTSGIDNIDVEAARSRGVTVIHLPGINADAVAEMVIGVMIALTRSLPAYDGQMKHGDWLREDCSSRHELRHFKLGIAGFGNVGSRVARLARAFRMEVLALDPYVSDVGDARRVASLEDLLAESDVLTLHVPLTEETRGMIGSTQIAALRPGSLLINASRGEVLDAPAALHALQAGHLGGLALDVFHPEPPQGSWPDDPRLLLTPHIAGCTHEAKSAAAQLLYERIVRAVSEG